MNEREKLIKKLIEEKGGSPKDYLNLLDTIAYHESAGTLDPEIVQQGGGPGRGKYQFEVGKNAGAITAAKRTKKYYNDNNIPVPEWLQKATQFDSLDASTLSSEQQDILFLGNMRKHPKADLAKVVKGEESITDFWANYHWAGADKDRAKRIDSFNSSIEDYKKKFNSKNNSEYMTFNRTPEIKTFNQTNWTAPIKDEKFESEIVTDNTSVSTNNDYMKNILSMVGKSNMKVNGGIINSNNIDKNLNEFNGGGTHEQNPLGGIPQGIGNNGKQNTVEENETSFELKGGKYIFSNRLRL